MKHSIGSISFGTMKPEDLIPAFLNELEELAPEKAKEIKKDVDKLQIEDDGYGELYNAKDNVDNMSSRELAGFILDDLFDALNDMCEPYFYFGSHPGDGADCGFWFDEDAFYNAIQDGDIVTLEDIPEFPYDTDAEYIAVINDHGNITLYTMYGKKVWAIV